MSVISQDTDRVLADYIRNFQYQKALDYIEQQEPTKELLIQKAICYKVLGNYKEALHILDSLNEEYNNDFQIISEQALCYNVLGNSDASIGCYDKLINLDSTNVYFKLQKADLLYQQEKYEKALELFRLTDNKFKWKRFGQCFEKMHMLDSAMIYFKEAWTMNPDDRFSAASLVNLCLKTDHKLEALSYSDTYMEKDTTDKQMNLLNALSYYSIDDYESAISKFKKCYDSGDSSLIVLRSLGISYYSMKRSKEAQPILERAFEQDSTNNNVLYCLAVSSNEIGECEKSIYFFNKLLDRTIPPDLTLYLYYKNLGTAYESASYYEESIDTFTKAINYADEDQKMTTYYLIANIYDNLLENKDKALVYFKLYKVGLTDYLTRLKEKDEVDRDEIADVESRLMHLKTHILEVEDIINNK